MVVLLMLAVCLALPAGAEAANKKGKGAKPRAKPRTTQRAQVKPRRTRTGMQQPGTLGGSRRAPVEQAYAYDDAGDVDQGYDDGDVEQEYEPEPPIRLGWVQGRRTHYRADGRMAPAAPGYRGYEPFVGGKSKTMSRVGMVVTTTLAIGIVAVAGLAIGVPLLHNLPQLLGLR
ncbi:MAG TPA: hypothetical protein VMZ28_07295 [Kofleriaceae bacterium]|nr:hypothetical protein [Kofleriaceae bacterium]